jgi:anti-sigma28 factor (negative regulator of flagellin synthesis)
LVDILTEGAVRALGRRESMKITRRPPTAEVHGLGEAAGVGLPMPQAVPPSERAAAGTEGRDRVDLSEAARLRQRLRTEVGNLDTMATRQVAELRARVAAGGYQPAPRAVAERLLRDLTADLLV